MSAPASSAESRRHRPASIVATALALVVAITAGFVLTPLRRAGAQPNPATTSTTSPTAPRAQAQAQPQPVPTTTATFTESAAAYTFLTKALGLALGTSHTITGNKAANGTLVVNLGPPTGLALGLPAGVASPVGATSVLTVDTTTGTETLTSTSASGSVSVAIAHAATTTLAGGNDVSGKVTDRVTVFGTTVTLTGTVSDTNGNAQVTLSGALAAPATVAPGVVLAQGTTLRSQPGGGLNVAGTATLGTAGHILTVAVSGTVTDTARWTLTVAPAGAAVNHSPIANLSLANTVTGTITDVAGTVRYDVRDRQTGGWKPVPGITVTAGGFELSNRLPAAGTLAAPGVVDGTDWAAVTGTVSVGALAASGTVTFNLTTGAGLLGATQSADLTLAGAPAAIVERAAAVAGHLQLGGAGVTGSVAGTGTASVQPKGAKAVTANATLAVTAGGTLVVSFPLDLSLVGTAVAGTAGAVYWTSAAVNGFAAGGGRTLNLPAGLSTVSGNGLPQPVAGGTGGGATTTTSPGGTTPPTTAPPATLTSHFTVSPAVRTFLAGLGESLGSPTLSGVLGGTTLTATLPAPTALPVTLPAGVPAPSFGPATITVDESTRTLTLDASATSPLAATLHVVIAGADTTTLAAGPDVTATLTFSGVPFVAGSSVTLTGSLSYQGGKVAASLTGTLESDLAFGAGVVLKQGAMVTLASDTGLGVTGDLVIGSGDSAVDLSLSGSVKDLKNWSLSLSDPTAPTWKPVPSLTISPVFSGSITDTDGKVRFDVATADANGATPLSWDTGAGAVLAVNHVEVSNAAPPSTVTCPNGVADGQVWVDLKGSLTYAPANLSLTAEGCINLSGQAFTVSTSATGTLLPGNPLFNLTAASLTVTGDVAKKSFTVTGSATLQVTAVNGQPTFPVGVSFGTDGIVVGAQLPDLTSLGFSGRGSIYVASAKVDNFDPATIGLSGAAFNLPAGLSVTLDYQLPANITSAFSRIGINLGPQTAVQAVATLSKAGFSLNVALNFGSQANGVQVVNRHGTALFLNSLGIGIVVGAQNQVTLSGSAFFELPALVPGSVASQVEVSLNGLFNFDSLTLSLGFGLSDWVNALGINGLEVHDFAGNLGITFETGIPTPSLAISADGIVLPATWAKAIGMVPGTQVSFNANVNLDAPLLSFSIVGPAGQPALTPLAVATTNTAVVNSLVVYRAGLVLAPFGGVTAAGDTVAPGISVVFDAVVDNVPAHIDASVGLAPPSLDADVSVGSFNVGPVNVTNPMLHLHLNPTKPIQIAFSGGVSAGNYSLAASVSLALGNSANGAGISLMVTGGLPYWLAATGTINGSVSGDGAGAYVSASGYGYLVAGGNQLGPVSFSYNGSLSWSDVVNSFSQIGQFFVNAGTQVDQVVQILRNLGANQQDIVNGLNSVGINPTAILNSITSVFGLINNNYDYIWVNPTAGQLYVLDVAGGSQAPNAAIIDWDLNGGYNQQWAFIPGPTGYEIVNRGSGQCLSVSNGSTDAGAGLVQYPCYGSANQLWNIGTLSTYVHQGISSVSSGLNVDVAGASFWHGAAIDQWPYNGGSNQYFWLSPGTN